MPPSIIRNRSAVATDSPQSPPTATGPLPDARTEPAGAKVTRRGAVGAVAAAAVDAVAPHRSPSTYTAPTVANPITQRPLPQQLAKPLVTAHDPAPATIDRAYTPRKGVAYTSSTSTARATAGATAVAAPSPALHLARRASWGATPALVAEIAAKGTTAWIDAQLSPLTAVPDTAMDSLVTTQWPILNSRIWGVRDKYYPDSTGDAGYAVIQAYLARAIWSKRQLLEVMVDFWTNHLVVTGPWGDAWDSLHRYHLDVIRRNALGRYSDMLVAAAKHPAMLQQLDNAFSTKRSPNENFGRELLELHTVGVDGGYRESDIRRSALVLTGMGIDFETGEYLWRDMRHYRGKVALLTWSNDNASPAGTPVVESYLNYLARHPKTARRIVTKLAVRFVSDTPPTTLIDRLAQVYLANDTQIAPVLRALLTSPEFAASAGQKTKRPLENIVSTVRVLGAQPGADLPGWLNDLLWMAQTAGQAPMGWPAPNGYPDVAPAWAGAGTTLTTWNFHMYQTWTASDPATTKVKYPALRTLLPTTAPATYGAYVDALAQRLTQAPLPAAKRDAVCAFLDKTAATTLSANDAALGWRLPYVVALILDSPEFATR
ncbi:DUF1800 domain-containing protein [Pedococcus soli]